MLNKMMIRKKAMDSMMKEGPAVEYKKKPQPMMDEMDLEVGGDEMEDEQSPEEMGFVQFMVSPEEKQMILNARKQKKSVVNSKPDEMEMEG